MTGPGLGKLAGGPGLESPPNQQNKSGGIAGIRSQIPDRIEASNYSNSPAADEGTATLLLRAIHAVLAYARCAARFRLLAAPPVHALQQHGTALRPL